MRTYTGDTQLMNHQNERSGSHAVVIGGSMAGLLAGRVLADHFDRVTIIERDRYPEGPEPRQGVPQARHLHVLLMRGRMIMERLFPGVSDELLAAGAQLIDPAADLAWLTPAGWGFRFQSGLQMLTFTRDLLDWIVRRRLVAFADVQFIEGCDVTGLTANAANDCVTGVSLRFRHRLGAAEELQADLVVDASGRTSKAPQWLQSLGYEPPEESVVNAHLGYASRTHQIPEGWQAGWKGVFVQAAPPEKTRAAVLFPIEGNRWLVTFGGGDRDYPPQDETGFLNYARSLPTPLIHDAIKNAQPLSSISGYRATENRMRHYERMSRRPDRFIIIGDGACAFNPVYGQGMTTAALGVTALDQCLRKQGGDLSGLARRFQRKLAAINAAPWMLATNEDYRYRGAEGGDPTRVTRLTRRYMDRVIHLTTESASVRLTFLEAQQMLKKPSVVFQPGIVLRVLWLIARSLLGKRRMSAEAARERRLSEMA